MGIRLPEGNRQGQLVAFHCVQQQQQGRLAAPHLPGCGSLNLCFLLSCSAH